MLARIIGIVGAFPSEMLARGRHTHKFFLGGRPFEREGGRTYFLQPKVRSQHIIHRYMYKYVHVYIHIDIDRYIYIYIISIYLYYSIDRVNPRPSSARAEGPTCYSRGCAYVNYIDLHIDIDIHIYIGLTRTNSFWGDAPSSARVEGPTCYSRRCTYNISYVILDMCVCVCVLYIYIYIYYRIGFNPRPSSARAEGGRTCLL